MTFYEAAIEVLRRSGRPLHFKKITEIAIRDGLLDHVGKTPDVTMSARLNQEVKREEQAAILRTRPGVFALRDDVAQKLNEEAAARDAELAAAGAEEAARAAEEAARRADEANRKEAARAEALAEAHRLLAAQQAAPAAVAAPAAAPAQRAAKVVAPVVAAPATLEEESEDEDGEEDGGAEGSEPGEGGRRRRRRRRGRRGRGGEAQVGGEGEEIEESARAAAPVAVVAPVVAASVVAAPVVAPVIAAPVVAEAPAPIVRERGGRERDRERGGRRERGDREDRGGREERNGRAPREEFVAAPVAEVAREERNGRAPREEFVAPRAEVAAPRVEAAKLDGFAQAAYTVLREKRAPLTLSALSDAIQERKLVRFHTHDAVATLRAALVSDNHIRSQRRARPLFASYEQGRWGLTDWGLTDANLRREQQISALAEECEQDTLRALGEALVGVSNEALEQLALQLLNRMGYHNIKVSKRSANGDVFFSADVRQGFRETRVCVQITGERAPLTQAAVVELRGTLHHYAASEGVILHLGDATREAIEESREARLAPVAVIDRAQLVRALLANEIGVKRVWAPILLVDTAFVDALKGGQGA